MVAIPCSGGVRPAAQARRMPSTAPCTASSRVMGSSKTMGGAPAAPAPALALRRRRLVLALLGASSTGAAAPAGQHLDQHPTDHIVTR